MSTLTDLKIRRLKPIESSCAASITCVIATTFGEGYGTSPERIAKLLLEDKFWLFGAFDGDIPVGGLTAHVLPMTREDGDELFIYDIAILPSYQRQGVGRQLIVAVLEAARAQGILSTFVPADNDDGHALDFYRSVGGLEQPVTFFNF
jgi:aminoglycoside 3-N-acetyltransferase I